MSVSIAIDHPRRGDAHPGSGSPGSFREDGSAQDNSRQPPALFQRAIALAALPSPVDARRPATLRPADNRVAAGRNAPETRGGAAAPQSRSRAMTLPGAARNGGGQQRPSRGGG